MLENRARSSLDPRIGALIVEITIWSSTRIETAVATEPSGATTEPLRRLTHHARVTVLSSLSGRPYRAEEFADLELEAVAVAGQRLCRREHL